jgi:hypothetical protein
MYAGPAAQTGERVVKSCYPTGSSADNVRAHTESPEDQLGRLVRRDRRGLIEDGEPLAHLN